MSPALVIDKVKQYPIAFGSGALLIVFSLMIFLRGGVVPELELAEADLNTRLGTIDQNSKNAIGIKEDAESLAVIVEKINSLLFDPEERAINVNFFYGIEETSGVVISGITQLPVPDKIYAEKGPRELKLNSTLVFDISCKGTFADVLKFLSKMDQVEPFMRVADIQISKGDASQVNARMRVLVLANKS